MNTVAANTQIATNTGPITLRDQEFLSAVDEHMHALINTSAATKKAATEAAERAVGAGGKRIRPLLVLAGCPDAEALPDLQSLFVRAGAAVELIHTASLVHDDLLDHAPLRRGKPTIGVQDGRSVAVATGDLLFSLAFRTLVESRESSSKQQAEFAIAELAEVSQTLAEGEALQADQVRDPRITEQAYFLRCQKKTGVLFRAALALGSIYGGATSAETELLKRFGEEIGTAFQLADDILDCSDESAEIVLGKRPGADVRDGTITLPMLYAQKKDSALEHMLSQDVADNEVEAILRRIRTSGALNQARAEAFKRRDNALELLNELRNTFDKTRLTLIANQSVDRIT